MHTEKRLNYRIKQINSSSVGSIAAITVTYCLWICLDIIAQGKCFVKCFFDFFEICLFELSYIVSAEHFNFKISKQTACNSVVVNLADILRI